MTELLKMELGDLFFGTDDEELAELTVEDVLEAISNIFDDHIDVLWGRSMKQDLKQFIENARGEEV